MRDEGEGIPRPSGRRSSRSTRASTGRSAHEVRNSHGLGLVFCRRAVEIHGGEIWVEENAARGSCFCVRLALRPSGARAEGVDGEAGVGAAVDAAAMSI